MRRYHIRSFPNFVNELTNNPEYICLPKPLTSKQFLNILRSYGHDATVCTGSEYGSFWMDDKNATWFILRWL